MNALAVSEISIQGLPTAPPVAPGGSGSRPALSGDGSQSESPWSHQGVEQAADGLNAFLEANDRHIQFSFNQEADQMVVEVVDNQTQEVIKTIPPKALVDLAAKIGEMVGMLMDKKG